MRVINILLGAAAAALWFGAFAWYFKDELAMLWRIQVLERFFSK
jgi:hypothetical protein